jgi:membrane associated rhomboid family serine protease
MRHSDCTSALFIAFLYLHFDEARAEFVKKKSSRLSTGSAVPSVALRGGSSRDDDGSYVLMIDSPTVVPPLTLGDIESLSSRGPYSVVEEREAEPSSQQRLFRAGNHRLSIVEYSKRYARHLFHSHPALAQLMAVCLVVFSFWQLPGMTTFLNQFFVCSRRNLRQGRWISLILSSISHSDVWHVLFNLAALLSLGPDVQLFIERYARQKGRLGITSNQALWLLVIGAALSGSIFYLLFGEIRRTGGGCLGLSSVTMALLAVYAQAYPDRILHIRLAGILPVRLPAYLLLQMVTVWSLAWSIATISAPQRSDGIAHSAHLGGLIFGLLYYACIVNTRGRSFRYLSLASHSIRDRIAGR